LAAGRWETLCSPAALPYLLEAPMVILGIILVIIGLIASIGILTIIGVILLVVGLVLNLVPVGGVRRRYY
jgi:hypothetical protein